MHSTRLKTSVVDSKSPSKIHTFFRKKRPRGERTTSPEEWYHPESMGKGAILALIALVDFQGGGRYLWRRGSVMVLSPKRRDVSDSPVLRVGINLDGVG